MCALELKKESTVGPWIIHEKLGEGAYGSVYCASNLEFEGKVFAIKVAPVNKNKKKNQLALLICHEVAIFNTRLNAFRKNYSGIPHFPISKMGGISMVTGKSEDGKIQYLAMEKFDNSLSEYLEKKGGKLPDGDAYCVAVNAIRILKFLHSRHVIYNDIKIENFLLRKTTNGFELVILDMGAAEVKAVGFRGENKGSRGTPLFTSINSNSMGNSFYSDDCGALGYMVAFLLLGKLPWENCKSDEEILKMKKSGVLEKSLKGRNELIEFINDYNYSNSDVIDYDKWIMKFTRLSIEFGYSGECQHLHLLPICPAERVKKIKKTPIIVTSKKCDIREVEVIDITSDDHENDLKKQRTEINLLLERKSEKRSDNLSYIRKQPRRSCKHSF